MIFAWSIAGFEWIIGIAIVFGLAMFMNVVIKGDMVIFLGLITIFDAFAVWGNLLPLYSLVLCFMVFSMSIYVRSKEKIGRE